MNTARSGEFLALLHVGMGSEMIFSMVAGDARL